MSGVLTKLPPATAAETERSQPHRRRAFWTYGRLLFLVFLLTLPFVNPWVRGDGVGYYAYVRAMLIDHNLRFEKDWRAANSTFLLGRVDANGRLALDQYTSTGYVGNNFSVGPAMLWAPFLAAVHTVVLGLNYLGAHIPADGFSKPYRVAMALATATYGFVGLFFAFCLARNYFEERWAFLATVGIWFASSLPVYMYLNPFWSHAHSVFAVSLFLWYWHRTRGARTLVQSTMLGVLSGLMINVYYINGVLVVLPMLEALGQYRRALRMSAQIGAAVWRLILAHVLYAMVVAIALLPTLITRQIIFGSPFETGYPRLQAWHWISPTLWGVLFSSNHGLFSWTPILFPAVMGLFFLWMREKQLGTSLVIVFIFFYYLIASRPTWHGLSSFGNRFFVSLTPFFILGLAALLDRFGSVFARRIVSFSTACVFIGLLIVWNVGFVFQWGTHMIPVRGPISWREMAYNQVAVVPGRLTDTLKTYLVRRKALMERIEQQDLKQLQSETPKGD